MENLPKDKVMYFTKEILIEANNAAIRENRNRVLLPEYLEGLISDKPYIVIRADYHKKDEIRLWIDFKKDGIGFLDVSLLRYKSIPIGTISEDRKVIPEDPEITELKRPYPSGREWKETVIRKPVRRQFNFRKEVLRAYSNQCAVCSVNNSKILRAAHILPVVNSADDSVNNGICLCINHEVAFDSNLLKIKPNGDIVVDKGIEVDRSKIRYPKEEKDYPSKKNLEIRYKNIENINDNNC